jgi:hypothetical protein
VPGRWPGTLAAVAAGLIATAAALTGCTVPRDAVPRCGDAQRLAIVAQSVPGASYVPCVNPLPPGWATAAFDPARGSTRFLLQSDRAPGRPVQVELTARCRLAGASPSPARADGVRTYTRLTTIRPAYAGTIYDVFPGGCVTYSFDFESARGQHIVLMEEWQRAIGLYPRDQLRRQLKEQLGVELDP